MPGSDCRLCEWGRALHTLGAKGPFQRARGRFVQWRDRTGTGTLTSGKEHGISMFCV